LGFVPALFEHSPSFGEASYVQIHQALLPMQFRSRYLSRQNSEHFCGGGTKLTLDCVLSTGDRSADKDQHRDQKKLSSHLGNSFFVLALTIRPTVSTASV
jgi:hypothetical protein